jgi:hypothetical protein
VARRVVHCARVFFSYTDGEDTLWAVGKKEEWGERVGQCFKTLAQVEYERELKKCPTAEKHLKHKLLWRKVASEHGECVEVGTAQGGVPILRAANEWTPTEERDVQAPYMRQEDSTYII